jgi:hypothetical protein
LLGERQVDQAVAQHARSYCMHSYTATACTQRAPPCHPPQSTQNHNCRPTSTSRQPQHLPILHLPTQPSISLHPIAGTYTAGGAYSCTMHSTRGATPSCSLRPSLMMSWWFDKNAFLASKFQGIRATYCSPVTPLHTGTPRHHAHLNSSNTQLLQTFQSI